ncbi:hypothetical protein P4679_25955 [Priestia megaterium]|uniref:hypothetical protein n=1 Tax=Priestia megaterium TaxID=1404 RepID=UPI002E22D156|nr:hypothetical protein [Priestia megaterium]
MKKHTVNTERTNMLRKAKNLFTRKPKVCKSHNHKIRSTDGKCIKCSYVREGYREEDFRENFPDYYKNYQHFNK